MLTVLLRTFPVKRSRELGRELESDAGVKGVVYEEERKYSKPAY